MTITEFFIEVTRITYIVLGVIAFIDLFRRRTRNQLDISLLFGSLALIVLAQEYTALAGSSPVWVTRFVQVNLMAHPYLLLRVVEHFRPVASPMRLFALVGLAASVLAIFLLSPLPTVLNIALILYFVIVEAYSVIILTREAFTTAGVTRWRLGLVALGSGMIGLIFLIIGVNILFPALTAYTGPFSQALSVFSGISYFLGISPPRWLRRSWQLNELYEFLREAAGQPATQRGTTTLAHLCTTAVRTAGGRAAVAALWDDDRQQLVIQHSTHPALSGSLSALNGITGKTWQTRQPAFATSRAELAPESLKLATQLDTRSLIAVPIATVEHTWGLLAVFLQRNPLFPQDDIDLLVLFAEQSALALEQAALLNEQKIMVAGQKQLLDQLRERSTQLEESNQELESFSYSVSHDLRAPLRHIEGFTDFLFKTGAADVNEKSRRYLTLISEASRRMGRLIDNLLAFSRLGRSAFNITLVDMEGLARDAAGELSVETEGHAVTLKIGRLPRIHGDADLLRMVFVNLISNAIKYSRPREAAEIEIDCLNEQSDGVVIYVRDNGVGFDMQYADKLFGVFQRLHHNDEFEGTGIGLANVRRIIHRHGGRTWAEATLNEGATFYFSLPSTPIEVAHSAALAMVSPFAATEPTSLGGPP